MVYSLGDATIWAYHNDMGQIQEERFLKNADLEIGINMFLDSDETDVLDNGGCVQKITATFIKIVDAWADVATFVQALLGLINGDQSPPNYPLTYVSDVLGTIYVKIESIDPRVIFKNGPIMIEYTINMIQSSELG